MVRDKVRVRVRDRGSVRGRTDNRICVSPDGLIIALTILLVLILVLVLTLWSCFHHCHSPDPTQKNSLLPNKL